MHTLLLHPTSIAQWYALLNEAQRECATYLTPELEYYLANLLIRFTNKPELANSVLGLDFLTSYCAAPFERQQLLKETGDKCLLFAGLFPEQALKRQLKLSYFITLGRSAYAMLSEQLYSEEIFKALESEFSHLMDVLQATRSVAHPQPSTSALIPIQQKNKFIN